MVVKAIIKAIGKNKVKPPEFPIGTEKFTKQESKTLLEEAQGKIEIAGSGKGKYNLYDKTIPGYMKKYANKWNAKVYDYRLSNPENPSIPVTVLELSDEMKTGVTSSSQPLFELFGTVGLSTWGAKEVSDNIENNIISQKTN